MRPTFTLGIEEEYQTIDPETRDLRSHIATEMLAKGKLRLEERVKAEMHQAVIEVGTRICSNIQVAQEDLFDLRRNMIALAEEHNLVLVAGATHPFADWRVQEIYPDPRYAQVVEDLQLVARANLIFGLHVHVGIEDREMQIQIMNAVRGFLPHLLALSVNSPFWCGRKTGVKSVRSTIFKRFPRTQIPDLFRSWHEYQRFVDLLVRTNCIDDAKKIWWDVRPHAHFKTLEFRICDIPSRMEETIMIAALVQALVCKLRRLVESNLSFRVYERAVIMENKFRALKRGLDGHMIAFDLKAERPTRELTAEILDFVDDVVDELGTREEMAFLRTWAREGDTGADRQIAVWEATHDLRAVVDFLVDETRRGL